MFGKIMLLFKNIIWQVVALGRARIMCNSYLRQNAQILKSNGQTPILWIIGHICALQGFSTFGGWQPTKQNKTLFGDSYNPIWF